jgi:adenosylcobalamin-dependent ribonucleoside-triphosphate reductase
LTSFAFTEQQLAKYTGKKPPFGILGAPTYMRTYSRPMYDGNGKVQAKEEFLDTIKRVVEGNINLGIENGDPTATREWAEEALEYMWHMGVMPPGRGYWMMGTEYATKRGGDAMNNCWYVAVRPQSYEHIEMFENQPYIFSHPEKLMASYPFVFMFDRAMLGGGVGFGAQRRNIHQMPKVYRKLNLKIFLHPNHPDWQRIKDSEEWDRIKDFITTDIEYAQFAKDSGKYYFASDDREGWNISVRETIDAHFAKTHLTKYEEHLVIDLSRIRQYDALIKGFGGTASGPLPLIAALVDINNILNAKAGKRITSEDALDMMNLLGRCVVAGNVRRTALIALGDHDDADYVNAKNYLLALPVKEVDENGWTIWDTNEWGRKTERRKPFGQVVQELYEKSVKTILDAGLELSDHNKEDLYRKAEQEADDLFNLAFKQENHRWASNNSVYTHEMFKDHHFIAAGIIANGEPGVGNEWLMKNFGRIMDGFQAEIDKDAEGLNPCAEITLWNCEPCNLVEVVPVMCKRFGLDVKRALQIGAQYTYRITFAKYIWKETARVIANNRRIGVSLTGMQDYFLEEYGHYAVKGFEDDDITKPIFHQEILDELDEWYQIVIDTNQKQARDMGAVVSKKTTTVKPSGTVAKLPGVSSGIHWNYAPYMIQRIRFHETDPYLDVLRACGFPIEKAQKEPNAVVVEFPIKNAGADNPNFLGAGDVPLEVQFANQYLFAYAWADNAVSATLTFKYEETDKIEPLLKAYNNKIKSTSLLPYSGHGYVQAPWEPITQSEYERRVSELVAKPEEIQHLFDLTVEPKDDLLDSDCIGGACPVK